jgi:hypothetical protein
MLGLLGAHVLLQRSTPDRSSFDVVRKNLRDLLGEHPDIAALEVLSNHSFDSPLRTDLSEVFDFPPMLRDGLLALDRARWSVTNGPRPRLQRRLAWLAYGFYPKDHGRFFGTKRQTLVKQRHSSENECCLKLWVSLRHRQIEQKPPTRIRVRRERGDREIGQVWLLR